MPPAGLHAGSWRRRRRRPPGRLIGQLNGLDVDGTSPEGPSAAARCRCYRHCLPGRGGRWRSAADPPAPRPRASSPTGRPPVVPDRRRVWPSPQAALRSIGWTSTPVHSPKRPVVGVDPRRPPKPPVARGERSRRGGGRGGHGPPGRGSARPGSLSGRTWISPARTDNSTRMPTANAHKSRQCAHRLPCRALPNCPRSSPIPFSHPTLTRFLRSPPTTHSPLPRSSVEVVPPRAPPPLPDRPVAARYWRTSSTRRFFALPSSVSFEATGEVGPRPAGARRDASIP